MTPIEDTLSMFGERTSLPPLDWGSVQARLASAGLYWVVPVPRPGLFPHPRPVWGVWDDGQLHLSIGSVTARRDLAAHRSVTVHLDGGTEVVVVEGRVTGETAAPEHVAAYDAKYEYHYDVERYGPLTTVTAAHVLAWHAAGTHGRDGFSGAGRWSFPP